MQEVLNAKKITIFRPKGRDRKNKQGESKLEMTMGKKILHTWGT